MKRPCASPRLNGSPCRATRARGSVFCPFHDLGHEDEGATWLTLEEAIGATVVVLPSPSAPAEEARP